MRIFIKIVFISYVIMSLFAFVVGLFDANKNGSTNPNYTWRADCLRTPSRIQKAFPAYKLGCYLGGAAGAPYYYQNKGKEVLGEL
jgi:hypothetical protein